jgi:hypothetical protein
MSDRDGILTLRFRKVRQHVRMEPARALLIFGTVLLTISALLGFVQYRHRERPDSFARWRVVHAGGTAGAVQLLALSAIWERLGMTGALATFLVTGLICATWAFFLGPLARALGRTRTANVINSIGAVVALPAYLALPLVLVL